METVVKPVLTVSFAVDLDIEYDPFEGRTAEDLAVALEDDLAELLYEVSPKVRGVFLSVTSVEQHGNG
jgi:hypothetical protein